MVAKSIKSKFMMNTKNYLNIEKIRLGIVVAWVASVMSVQFGEVGRSFWEPWMHPHT